LEIPKIPIEDFLAKTIKTLTGEKTSLINIGLKLQMHTGKVLQGKILNILPKKKAMILVEGKKIIVELPEHSQKRQGNHFSADFQNSYKTGKNIYLKVEKSKPSLILKVISSFEQKYQDEGYTTNLSLNTKNKIIKFNDYKFPLYKSDPDKIIHKAKELWSDSSKFQSNDPLDNKFYGKNENLKLSTTFNSAPPSSQKNQQNEFSINLSKNTKTENFDLPIFRDLKLIFGFIFLLEVCFFHFLSYIGTFVDKELKGRLATSSLSKFKTIFLEFVVFPIIAKSKFHFLKIFFAFSTFSEFIINNILSWLSESIIS